MFSSNNQPLNKQKKDFRNKVGEFLPVYEHLRELFKKNKWSLSSIQRVMIRFVEGFQYDGLHIDGVSLNDIDNRVLWLREHVHDRQSKVYFVIQYGESLGLEKFEELQKKQAYTNSKEHKGMTDEEFKEYNKSRSCTLENFIKRHGETEGRKLWDQYVERQSYTKSKQRYIDENRLDEYFAINKKKALTLENFIRKYGDELGHRKFNETKNSSKFHSKIASELFAEIEKRLSEEDFKHHIIYAPKCGEFEIPTETGYYFYDFVIPELKYCIEFNGDIWHANPKMFESTDTPNPFSNETAEEIWKHDKEKNDLIKNKGFHLDIIWESDYRNNKVEVVNKIIENVLKMKGLL